MYYFSINAKLTRHYCQMIIFTILTLFLASLKLSKPIFEFALFIIEHIIVASYFYTIIVNAGC